MRRLIAGALILAVSCTSTTAPRPVLSPAPRDCPWGLVRAGPVTPSEFVRMIGGHAPTDLPGDFGLVFAVGRGDGYRTAALWADSNCRQVFLALWPREESIPDGPKVGIWTVTDDVPDACGNGVLGTGRCLNYRATFSEGTIGVQMIGVDRPEGDQIVASIPVGSEQVARPA